MYIQDTYQVHHVSNSSLNVKSLDTLDPNHVALRSKGWELYERAIGLHDLLYLVQSTQQDTVNLGCGNNSVFHENSCPVNQLVDLLLCRGNVLWRLSSDENLFRVSSLCSNWAVSIYLGEGRWEIDSGIRG